MKRYTVPWAGLALASAALFIASCASTKTNLPALTQHREADGFASLAADRGSDDAVVMVAASQFLADRREHDGLELFGRLAREQPDRPIFRGLEGMMQARVAGDITLLSRVSWVEDAIRKLDEGARGSPLLGRYVRGIVLAVLPERFGKAREAIADLEAVLREHDRLPFDPDRGIYRALAAAWRTAGDVAKSDEMLRRAGAPSIEGGPELFLDASATRTDGFRFSQPHLVREADGVYVAEGFDFSTMVFLIDASGIVVIDAGTTEKNANAAMAALRQVSTAPVKYVILTHGHWDHVGGLGAVREAGTTVIASANTPAVLTRSASMINPYREYFWGTEPISLDVKPDHLVSAPETLRVGAIELEISPAPSGETEDALFILDRSHELLFVGDAFMPYVGAPFFAEGSVDGYLAAAHAAAVSPATKLIHGHPALTRYWTKAAMPGLDVALQALRAHALGGALRARPLSDVLHDAFLPTSLHQTPPAAMPYMVMRDTFVQRLYRERAGYWASNGVGMDELTDAEWARALDRLGGESSSSFARVVGDLLARGDTPLALRIADLGLRAHPHDAELESLRATVLNRLQARYQQINPFRFIVYSQLSGHDVPPTASPAPSAPRLAR